MKYLSDNNFNNNQLDNVPTPTDAGDATNKEYVDTSISSISKNSIGLGNVTNDLQLKASDLDTDVTLAADSDSKIPSQKAVKNYIDKPYETESVNQPTEFHAFGDSITYGMGLPNPATDSYVAQFAARKGWSLTNHAVSGARINDGYVADAIFSQIVDSNKNYLLTIGTNNAKKNGMDLGWIDTFRGALMSELAWLAIPDSRKIYASTMTQTGTWSANPLTVVGSGNGLEGSGAGSSLTATVTGTSVYVCTYATISTHRDFKIIIDGVDRTSWQSRADNGNIGWNSQEHSGHVDTRQDDSLVMSPYLVRYEGLAPGAHTVKIEIPASTWDSSQAGIFMEWVAGNGDAGDTLRPNVYVGNIIRATDAYYSANPTYSDAVVGLYNSTIAEVVSCLRRDGMNIRLVDLMSSINNTTDMQSGANLHPNYQGNQKMADALFGAATSFSQPNSSNFMTDAGSFKYAPTLESGFVNFGGMYGFATYYKDSNGIVHLEGSIKNSGVAKEDIIFRLPVGYRPYQGKNFAVTGNDGIASLRIRPGGTVHYISGTVSTYMSLDGISFRAEH